MNIQDELVDELQRELSSVMSLYMQGANDTEWIECAFCGNNADADEEVQHSKKCLAVRLLHAIDEGKRELMDREDSG